VTTDARAVLESLQGARRLRLGRTIAERLKWTHGEAPGQSQILDARRVGLAAKELLALGLIEEMVSAKGTRYRLTREPPP
jgi:hypothetical protein